MRDSVGVIVFGIEMQTAESAKIAEIRFALESAEGAKIAETRFSLRAL